MTNMIQKVGNFKDKALYRLYASGIRTTQTPVKELHKTTKLLWIPGVTYSRIKRGSFTDKIFSFFFKNFKKQ